MAELLAAATQVPIVQLSPELSSSTKRYIRAIVTLIWPYSSSTSTLKVLLAEPDFRLRRAKGQVRVQFSGSSARSVFEAGIGSGDEIILSLDGVEWSKDESAGHTPGRSIDWELKFSERLVLKIVQSESEKVSLLDIDHPIPRIQLEAVQNIPELEPLPSPPKLTASKHDRPGLVRSETNEWSSPAFVKRARISYGSLFESGYDIFAEDDGTIEGKGRKRTRFGRTSGAWRYSSRSQSPESNLVDKDVVDSSILDPDEEKPLMTDEGCQTLGLEDNNAAEALADLSRQQELPIDNSIILEDSLGAQQQSGHELTGGLSKSEASVNVRPHLLSPVALQDRDQEESTEQQAISHNMERVLGSIQTDPIRPDIMSAIPLLVHSDSTTNEAALPSTTNEAEDLYGLSPTANGYPRNAVPETSIGQTGSDHNAIQSTSENSQYEATHHYQDNETFIAYPKLASRSASPDTNLGTAIQTYPEPDTALNDEYTASTGPYFGEPVERYPDVNVDRNSMPPDGSSEMHAGDIRSPNSTPLMENEALHDTPVQKLLARHIGSGGISMSRSHSGQSEMVDLTEDSDDQGEDVPEDSETDDEEQSQEQLYRRGQAEHQFSDEQEGYENLLYNSDGSESGENEFVYDDEDNIIHPPDFHPAKNLAPGEVMDDEEREEEYEENEMGEGSYEGSYDEEEVVGEDEDASIAIKRPHSGKPEVIDLLSSDEEDGENDNVDDIHSLHGDGAGASARLDETEPMFVEEEESDEEAESNEESSEEEIMDDGYAKEDLPDDPAELATMDESEKFIDESELEEDETVEVEETEIYAETLLSPPNLANRIGSFQDVLPNTRKLTSALQSQLSSYVGNDGASDNVDRILVAPREDASEGAIANVNGNKLPVSKDVVYPKLPVVEEKQPLVQEKSAQHEDVSELPENDQLPTPDATQLSAVINPDISLGSIDSIQPPSPKIDASDDNVEDMEDSSQSKPMEIIEEASTRDFVNESIMDAPKEAGEEIHRDTVAETTEETVRNVITSESKSADEKVTVDTITKASLEVIREETPNRSSNTLEESVKDVVVEVIEPAPVTPRRSKRLSFSQQQRERVERSPSLNMDEPSTPDEYDASVELAMAALDSPSKQHAVQQHISEKQLRVMLSRPLRTSLGYFTTLKLVRFNLEKKLDVLAIVTSLPSEPQRAKHGLRHYHLRYNVTDATVRANGVISVNIFRPYKTALPTVQLGEVVLLRNFLAKSEKGASFTLRSDEASSWVVFKHGGEEEVRGPPVEYGDEERDHVAYLRIWYRIMNSNSGERLEMANGNKGT